MTSMMMSDFQVELRDFILKGTFLTRVEFCK